LGRVNPWLLEKLERLQLRSPVVLRLIVEYEPDYRQYVKSRLRALPDVTIVDQAPALNMIRVTAPAELVDQIAAIPHVVMVSYDMPVRALVVPIRDPLVGDVRIDEVTVPPELLPELPRPPFPLPPLPRPRIGFVHYEYVSTYTTRRALLDVPRPPRGRGVRVAVIDTGADFEHFQLIRRVEYLNTTGEPFPIDLNGHGTHVATISCGGPWVFPLGNAIGIAPESSVLGIKALGTFGAGFAFDIIKAMELAWMRGAKLVNMSLGSTECQGGCYEPDGGPCPFCKATKFLTDNLIIPIIAAGNSGPDYWTLCCPGCSPHALTVGSYSFSDKAVAWFSSRGPQNPANAGKMTITDITTDPRRSRARWPVEPSRPR